jgi:ABC-type antimicrobial peptide transport system permease subunit
MLFGLLVALILLVLALLAVFTDELRRQGAIDVVYALIVPIFGVTQQMILAGELHWLIETAHLAVGFGALALIGNLSAGLARRRLARSKPVAALGDVPQVVR